MNIRLVVANHNPAVRKSFSLLAKITPGAECVGIAQSGEEMVALNEQHKPDIILLELPMLQEHARTLFQTTPDVKLICIMNIFDPTLSLEGLLAMGSVGCICQNASPMQIRDAVVATFLGEPYEGDDVAIGVPAPHVKFGLSAKEVAVLQALTDDAAQNTSYENDLYLSNILSKLGLSSAEDALAFARDYALIT